MTIDAAFIHFPSLTTNRLLLRQIQPKDGEAFFATFSDEEVMEFYAGSSPKEVSLLATDDKEAGIIGTCWMG